MAVTIRLLGPPSIDAANGAVRRPRGRKGWAVLGYVLSSELDVPRQRLAELLFGEANDPLGALRWTLADLRRAIGIDGLLRGDPVCRHLGSDVAVDLDVLSADHVGPELLLALGGEFLEGVHIAGAPAFESWLVAERHRLSAAIEGRLRQAAISLLAVGSSEDAVAHASQAVERNWLDEANHELLVRCLAATGDEAGARRQLAVSEALLTRELGVAPSPSLRAAASRAATDDAPATGLSAARSLLEAGRAAVGAGAVEAGLDCLRRAVAHAVDAEDPQLQGQALVALGGALVHGVRGRDGEGAITLHQAIAAAERADDRPTLAGAYRELGFVEVQAGRGPTASVWLERAESVAECDEDRAAVLGVHGMRASDRGSYGEALRLLQRSVALAQRAEDPRQQAWSLSMVARAHLLRDECEQAAAALAECLQLVNDQRWLAFAPWPQALQSELDHRQGTVDTANRLDEAWALACELGDPCWQGMTARMLGLRCSAEGDRLGSERWLDEAHRRCTSVSDRYQWVTAYVLDARVALARSQGRAEEAHPLIESLSALAARCAMAEFVVRACLHRWRLGDGSALGAARLLSDRLDNPALDHVLDSADPHDFDRLYERCEG